jgi:hypothetical protein
MRDADAERCHRTAPKEQRNVLEADGVCQIPTHFGGHEFKAVGSAVREPRREQIEERAHLLRTLHGRIRTQQGHGSLLDHIACRAAESPLHIAFSASICRGRTSARNRSNSVIWDFSSQLARIVVQHCVKQVVEHRKREA